MEQGPIRPPSEAYSLLVRVTRNCPWNRCKFCPVYKNQKFQVRPVADIRQDILYARMVMERIVDYSVKRANGYDGGLMYEFPDDADRRVVMQVARWLHNGGTTAFLQDANSLIIKTAQLAEVIRFLKETLPAIDRITSYARSETAARKSPEELKELHEAGLTRLHIGLESGFDPLLEFMNKGVTAAEHIAAGQKVVASGISLCEYVVLGLGGKEMGREHALQTARVLNAIDPDYIRVRTLSVNSSMPLWEDIANGSFRRAGDEEILRQERLMLENLECHSNFVSDHITNLLPEIEGKLPEAKTEMLGYIDCFLSLSPEEKTNYQVGRRLRIYEHLDDLNDARRHAAAEQAVYQLSKGSNNVDEQTIMALMEEFV